MAASQEQAPPRKEEAPTKKNKLAEKAKLAAVVNKISNLDDESKKGDSIKLRRTLSNAIEWDVWSPPPDDSLKGHFVPNMLNRYSRRRRISLEVHRIHLPAQEALPDTISTTPGLLEQKGFAKEGKKDEKSATTKKGADKKSKAGSAKPDIATIATVAKAAEKFKKNVEEHYYDEILFRVLEPVDQGEKKASRNKGKKAIKNLKAKRKMAATGTAVRLAGTRSVDELRSSSTNKEFHTVSSEDASDNADDDSSVDTHRVMQSDDQTYVSTAMVDIDKNDYVDLATGEVSKDWTPKYAYSIDAVTITKQKDNKINILTKHQGVKHARTLIFDKDEDALYFVRAMEEYQERHRKSVDHKLKQVAINVDQNKKLSLLIEIVSAWDLPAADISLATPSSDPFVKVYMNGVEVHRTKHISKNLNPIWTLKTGSLFILECTVKELFASPEGLMFQVFDFDKLGASDSLGCVMIPPKVLYDANSERMECKLSKAPKQDIQVSGFLAVRCRHATQYDKEFMENYLNDEKEGGNIKGFQTVAEKIGENVSGGATSLQSYLTKYKKVEREGPNAGKQMYKIRPKPDPKRVEETTWMTKEQIEKETYKDSQHWLDVSTGSLGRLFVEVLSCDNLPNLDTGIAGNKTDAFVCCVFEDVILKSDIIDDTLSPRWLPWTKRAFIFNIRHSSSQLFLGVFDFDGGQFDDHDMIGRVAVNISNMKHDTVYLLKYDLFSDVSMSERDTDHSRGVITLRVRLEVDDERRMLMGNLCPVPEMYVNVKNRKDLKMARETMRGTVDTEAYNKAVIQTHIDELTAYKFITYQLEDAIKAVLLWRGIVSFKFFGQEFTIPVHSMIAFLAGITIVERPSLVPSFFFASIAWMLLALMGWRIKAPNPWARCKGFHEFLQVLIIGKSLSGPEMIKANENYEASKKFDEELKERMRMAEKQAEMEAAEALEREEERQKKLAELGGADKDISDKSGGISIDPFKSIFYPIQQYLGMTVKAVRLVKYVACWTECYFAFWFATGCFLLAFICLLIPWAFILRWTSRIIVWTLLGPWMKLVDVFYFSKIKALTEEELKEKLKADKQKHKEETIMVVAQERIEREDAVKLKEMKQYMFGQYICKVPIVCTEKYLDVPRSESVAIPYKPEKLGLADLAMKEAGYNRTRLPGQNLTGEMVLKVESKSLSDAPTGKAVANVDRLDEKSPGVKAPKTESNAAAYAKLGSLVVVAAVVSWFGVPYVSWATESAWLFAKAKAGF